MAGMSAEQIYSMLAQEAEGKTAYETAFGVSWNAKDNLADRAVQITRLATKIESHWQGDAGGSAARGLGPISTDLDAAAAEHNTAQDAMNRQMGDFARARDSVVPVPPAPRMQDPTPAMAGSDSSAALGSALTGSSMQQQTDQRNEAAAHNVRVYNSYHDASNHNYSTVPQSATQLDGDRAPMQAHQPSQAGSAPAGAAPAGGSAAATTGPSGAYAPPASQASPQPPGSGAAPAQPAPGSGAGAFQPGGGRSGSGARQAPPARYAPEVPPAGSGTGAAAAIPGTGGPSGRGGYVPPLPGAGQDESARPGASAGGSGGTGGGVGGVRGGGTGSGRIGQVLGGRAAPGGGPGGAMGARGGAMGTAAPGGQAAPSGTSGAAAGGQGGRGGSPMGAVPPGGAGRGGDEDSERKRKYGQDPDKEEVFGVSDDPSLTDASVLGETRDPGEKKDQ